MDPILGGSLLSGGLALLGGILGNSQSAENTSSANAANLRVAREQMNFQERMSNSAYQRAMADMGKAGLNPILAYQQGGASSPNGASIQMQAPNYQDPLAPAVSSAVDTYNRTSTVRQASQGLALQEGQLKVSQANSTAEVALKAAQAAATTSSAMKTQKEIQILDSRAKKEKLEGDFFGSKTGKNMYYLQKINEAAGGSLDTLNSAKDLLNPFKMFPKGKKIENRFNHKTGEIEQWIP